MYKQQKYFEALVGSTAERKAYPVSNFMGLGQLWLDSDDRIVYEWTGSAWMPSIISGFDPVDNMYRIKSMQKKFRDSFTKAALNAEKWDSTIGSGGAISQSGGILTMGSGTVINSITEIVSKETFTIPARLSIGLTLSQRIANQEFTVEFVSCDPETLVPDDKHVCGFLFDGATATQGKYQVKNDGHTPLISTASTLPTTTSGGLFEIEPFADECWFHGGTLDATSGRANSYRRHQQLPDPNALYKARLRWKNLGSAPASNTNAAVQFITVNDYAELTAEITAGRGQTVAGQAMGVAVVSIPTVNSTPTTPTLSTINSAATTNATSVKASGGTIYSINISNTGATARYVKLYNKASAPTVGIDVPVLTIPVAAGGIVLLDLGAVGLRLGAGIALAITAGAADADTAAVGASEVKMAIAYL